MRWATVAGLVLLVGCASPPAASTPEPEPARSPRATTAPSSATASPPDGRAPQTVDGGSERTTRPLFRRFPTLAKKLPHLALADLPTPIEHNARLGDHLGVGEIYLKRDDLSASAYGGGKPRKLEPLLGEAVRDGHTTVVTTGGVGSNQAVATSIFARQLGLDSIVLLLPQASTAAVRRNLLANHLFGAEMRLVGSQADAARTARRLAEGERRAYVIPAGGSSPLGNTGFVNAGLELADQVAAGELPTPDYVYIALGTMGSAVGLVIGLKVAGLPTRVVAVRASNRNTSTRRKLEAMYRQTVAYLRSVDETFPEVTLAPDDLVIEGRYLGGGYAKKTRRGEAAIETFRRHTGLELELTYTAKAFAALAGRAKDHQSDVVVFWNTQSSRPLDVSAVGAADLPRAFHPYFVGGG